jgi:hypothetical protein
MAPLVGLPESALVDVSGVFPVIIMHHGFPCSCITWRVNNKPLGGAVQKHCITHRHDHKLTFQRYLGYYLHHQGGWNITEEVIFSVHSLDKEIHLQRQRCQMNVEIVMVCFVVHWIPLTYDLFYR